MKNLLIIVILGFLVYSFSLSNGFVWDDEIFIQGVPSFQNSQPGTYFRPVMSTINSIIYNVFGPRPFFFHLFQLIFHIATAVLIYYLFKRFLKETTALILALIFLVHPANVEAVSFTSAMQDVIFTFTGLIGLYLFVDSENLTIIRVFSATILLLLALLVKETAIVFFPLIFCYLIIFKKKQTGALIDYSIFAPILLMTYFLVRIAGGSLYVQGQGVFPIMRVSLITRLINIPSMILYYLKTFFYPMNLATAQHWVIRSPDFNHFFLPLIIEILFFSGAVFYILKKKNKTFAFFFLWFLIGLLPHLQIIPLNMTVAERWLYFPMIGLLGMIGTLLSRMGNYRLDPAPPPLSFPRRRESILLFSLGIIIIILFSIRSFIRTLDWHNGMTLYSRDIRKDSNFDLQNNLGVELFRIGKFKEAKKYFEISVKLAPYWWVNWNNLGAVYEREKNYRKATEYYQKSIKNGQYELAYENLAKILVLYPDDRKKTEEFLKEALGLFPTNVNIRQAEVYYQQKVNQK